MKLKIAGLIVCLTFFRSIYASDNALVYHDYFRPLEVHSLRVTTSLLFTQLLGTSSSAVPHWGGVEAEYSYWFLRYWGLSLGVRYGSISSSLTNHDDQSLPMIDSQGQPYAILLSTRLNEQLSMDYVSLPLSFRYRHPVAKRMDIEVAVGGTVGFVNRVNYGMQSGYFTRHAWYEQMNILIDNLPQKQFGRFDSFAPSSPTLSNPLFFTGQFQLAIRYDLLKGADLHANRLLLIAGVKAEIFAQELNFKSGSVPADQPYQGSLLSGQANTFRPLSYGIFVGFSYVFKSRHHGSYWKHWSKHAPWYMD